MAVNYPKTEPNDLYTRDFLVKVPIAFHQDSQPNKRKQPTNALSYAVSCCATAAMIIYLQATIRSAGWDFKMVILVLLTGVVSFALAHIFRTLFFNEKQ